MTDADWEEWRTELMRKLEALHILVISAEAFHSAVTDIYQRLGWPAGYDLDGRRDRNRVAAFLEQLGIAIDQALTTSREAVEFATRRIGKVSG